MQRFPVVTPEIDTIRFFFHLWQYVDLYAFFDNECKRGIMMYQREIDENGQPRFNADGSPMFSAIWEKKRADCAPSWYQKMQITVEQYKEGDTPRPVLSVEYSVAKWYNVTNGVNSGRSPSFLYALRPIWEVLNDMHIVDYTHYNRLNFLKIFINHVQLRRIDLSYNFKTNFPVTRCLLELSTCRINNKAGDSIEKNVESGTVSWGGGRGSMYKAMFYDKEKEQKEYFHKFNDNTLTTQRNKLDFWNKHKDIFSNVLRFEVQYRSKYFLYHFKDEYKDKKNMEIFNKIIDLCEWNWGDLLRKFDEQLNISNVRPEEHYTLYQDVMKKLDHLGEYGFISLTKSANLKNFVEMCFKQGWESVWRKIGRNNFSVKYREVKKLTEFDIKNNCVALLPIMRIMQNEGETWNFAIKWKCDNYPAMALTC